MVIFEFPLKLILSTFKGHEETPSYHVIIWNMGNNHMSQKNHQGLVKTDLAGLALSFLTQFDAPRQNLTSDVNF